MSIAKRLFQIARAHLASRGARDFDRGARDFENEGSDRGARDFGGSWDRGREGDSWDQESGRSVPEIDPELARYYANLELPLGADLQQVKEAWKRLVRRYHPDLHSTDPDNQRVATELVQGLNRAYEELRKRLK